MNYEKVKYIYILLIGVIFFNKPSFAKTNVAQNKNVLFIILGAGARIDQEYNDYAKQLENKGYKIEIHSFDPYYGNNGETEDKELNAKIRDCTDEEPYCQTIENGLKNEKFKHINYTVFEDAKKDFIYAKRYNKANKVNLTRYTTAASTNNRNGQYIAKLFEESIEKGVKVVFIDAVWCGGLQPITKSLFAKYAKQAIFIHAVHNRVQVINQELLDLSNNAECTAPKKILTYKYRCINETMKLGEDFFNQSKKMHKLIQRYGSFAEMSLEEKQEFITATAKREEERNKFWSSESCINDKLHNSIYQNINQEVVDLYDKK
jgi:hypothetical protein